MGKTFDEIDDATRRFLEAQRMFFVASAPLDAAGHVNLSPKGLDTFRVLDSHTVCYLDFVGSGVETIAHVRENGRIVLMFCAFEGPPKIIRLHGRGTIVEPGDPRFAELAAKFATYVNTRAVIVVTVERIANSCGFGVPLYEFRAERSQLDEWTDRHGAEGVARYKREHNGKSIDGLAALRNP